MDAAEEAQLVTLLTNLQLSLRTYVHSLLPGDAGAEDVVQRANATLWKKRDAFEIGTNFRAWAFSIARYEVLNHRKELARQNKVAWMLSEESMEAIAGQMQGDSEDDLLVRQKALRVCLNKLSPRNRQLIMQRYAGKGRLSDFAAAMGRRADSLKVSMFRIRNSLGLCIRQQLKQAENA